MRGNRHIIPCFHFFEVSQASYIQEEDITPLNILIMYRKELPKSNTKVIKN